MWQYFNGMMPQLTMHNSNLGTHCEIVPMWKSQNLTSEKSTSVQITALNHHLTNVHPDSCRHMASIGHNGLTNIMYDFFLYRNGALIMLP